MDKLNTEVPISVWNYARGNNNRAIHVEYLNVTFYMSYDTCIAFKSVLTGLVVHDNIWSNTTGAHLNAIDGGSLLAKTKRVDAKEFALKLNEVEQNHRRGVISVYEILKDKKEQEFRNHRLAERQRLNGGYSKAGH